MTTRCAAWDHPRAYRDDQAWQGVAAALTEPWGDRQFEVHVHFIDDPAWAGAAVDEVLTAVRTHRPCPLGQHPTSIGSC
ncbi:DUF6924 domain-containing protein [Streptomyces niveus]|uniref:DUF6924 domain-containing protein n=1 Tax=Streptomyces niveus TaxID=193462 RepID=UPI0036CA5917